MKRNEEKHWAKDTVGEQLESNHAPNDHLNISWLSGVQDFSAPLKSHLSKLELASSSLSSYPAQDSSRNLFFSTAEALLLRLSFSMTTTQGKMLMSSSCEAEQQFAAA